MTTKENILTAIRTHKPELRLLGVNRIGLFGSYVRNEQSIRSDIDILVDFDPEKETFDNYMALYDYLENLFAKEKIEPLSCRICNSKATNFC